ncbi:CBS domain-containing protein [Candidatus Saccharibacteria bacterium]|nr:CBS domain-containing protein [Candidatus Saccharibacteria bacterium]
MAAFNRSAEFFLRLVGVLSGVGLILVAAESNRWLGLATAVVTFWLVWKGHSPRTIGGWRLSLSALAAPLFTAFVSFLQPFLGWFTDWLKRISPLYPPTGLYEKEDLLEFLKIQARQPDNRIPSSDLKTAGSALSLGDRTIGDVMLPRRQIKWVAVGDPIGPMVMDELHKSGQVRFPVVKETTKAANPEVVGVLYHNNLLEHMEDKGRIRDIMHPGVSYINESRNLRGALDGFLKSGQLLLVVVNNFEEVVGVVTLEDIFGKIFGDKIGDEFDRYHDIRAVSGHNGQTRGQPTRN